MGKNPTKPPRVFHLLYKSFRNLYLTDIEIQQILNSSRTNNKKISITGLLLYRDGAFVQLLEGSKDAVIALYKRVEKDSRHRDCKVVATMESEARIFPQWGMGFVGESFVDSTVQGFLVLLEKELKRPGPQSAARLLSFLQKFNQRPKKKRAA